MIIIAIFREMTSKWYQGQLGGPNYLLVTSLLPERQITNQLTALCCFRITIATTHITPFLIVLKLFFSAKVFQASSNSIKRTFKSHQTMPLSSHWLFKSACISHSCCFLGNKEVRFERY